MTLGKERETGPGSLLAHIKMQGAAGGEGGGWLWMSSVLEGTAFKVNTLNADFDFVRYKCLAVGKQTLSLLLSKV